MNIITKDNCILIDDVAYPKNGFKVSKKKDSVTLSPSSGASYVKVPVEGTTIDGVSVTDSTGLFGYFLENGFNSGGTEPSDGVQSVKDSNVETGVGNINFWTGTQAEYDAITTKNPATLYFVK